jgi:hypothetical protein
LVELIKQTLSQVSHKPPNYIYGLVLWKQQTQIINEWYDALHKLKIAHSSPLLLLLIENMRLGCGALDDVDVIWYDMQCAIREGTKDDRDR